MRTTVAAMNQLIETVLSLTRRDRGDDQPPCRICATPIEEPRPRLRVVGGEMRRRDHATAPSERRLRALNDYVG